jgi:outer membrane protein
MKRKKSTMELRVLIVATAMAALMAMVTGCLVPARGPFNDRVGPQTSPEEKKEGIPVPPPAEPVDKVPPIVGVPPKGPLDLSLPQAILLGLENNREFRVQDLQPQVQRTYEGEEEAFFDPILWSDGGVGRERTKARTVNRSFGAEAGISQYLPFGTALDFSLGMDRSLDDPNTQDPDDEYKTYVNLGITQALLRGAGRDVNLASLRQARIDTQASEYELRGLAEALTASIEDAYWDCLLAQEEQEIYTKSLDLASRLAAETRERIQLGQVARTEIYFAEAEAAVRQQNLINAQSRLKTNRLLLLRLVNPPGTSLWDRDLQLRTLPATPEARITDIGVHLAFALRMRPDLNQARLAVERGDLEVVKTRNGLLPRLDLFITLGRSGYSHSFGNSVRDVGHSDGGLDVLAGFRFEFPPINRGAKARYERSALQLGQDEEALENLAQLVEEDVLSARIEINRAWEQIRASAITVTYQQKKLQAEIDRYRLGKSTMYRVAQTERDLVESEVSQVQARIDYLKSLTRFFLAEGSLLLRRGIEAPGREPVELAKPWTSAPPKPLK